MFDRVSHRTSISYFSTAPRHLPWSPDLTGSRPRCFGTPNTGVEVNVASPNAISVPTDIAKEVARTAMVSDGIRVASESGLVALKLFRKSYYDQGDIVALIKTGRVDLSGFPLAPENMAAFWELVEDAKTDPRPP